MPSSFRCPPRCLSRSSPHLFIRFRRSFHPYLQLLSSLLRPFPLPFSLPLFVPIIIVVILWRLSFLPQPKVKAGERVRIKGTLAQEPALFGSWQRLSLAGVEFWAERYPEYHYGDWLEVEGVVKIERERKLLFDWPSYSLAKTKIKLVNRQGNLGVKGLALGFKERLRAVYRQSLRPPLNGIVAGIVLGDKSLINERFWQSLKETGTLHVMVASGMNIALFSGSLLSFLMVFLKRQKAIFFLVVVIWFYSIMTGLEPPIVRAATMASLLYLSQVLGREAGGERVLWLSGGLMVFISPRLVFDLGFQLSFLATAGLVYLQPLLAASRWPFLGWANFSSTLAAQLMTLPLLWGSFGEFNLASPFINLAILWAIPIILQAGVVIGLLGLLWMKAAFAASMLIYPLLFWVEQTILLSAKGKVFQLDLPVIRPWVSLGYYLFLAGLIIRTRRERGQWLS